ncbi:tyrosine-protein phosphatase [Longispora albida]|uniref:tyrosine-protein phosphatase n=1 Tax=Longispora albida TaxID=203523 RepID=UPI00037067A4|nr:tyrosine-protein phosphatase [Longispora albida]
MTERHIPFGRVYNFRDLGGYTGHEGRTVRWGLLYRSASLAPLAEDGPDRETFAGLGVRTVVDLRYPWEVERSGRFPETEGVAYHNLSVEHRPYQQASMEATVEPGPFLAGKYMEVASDGVKEIRQVLDLVAEDTGPLVFHCMGGKDRTGLIAALVLSLLGVSEEDIVADFAITGQFAHLAVARFVERTGKQPSWPYTGQTPPEVMEIFLAELKAEYGSVREYCATALGIDDAFVETLRARLLTD